MTNETLKVLLVEDDEDYYGLIQRLLAKPEHGEFVLDWVPTYDEGVEEIEQERHDVYVFDHRLGTKTGLELLQHTIEKGCAVPVVILTGAANHETAVAAMKAGAADYLVKGNIHALLLQRTLRYVVHARRAAETNREAEGRFRAAFANAPTGMALVDLSASRIGRLLDVNPALCAMAERSSGELLDGTIWALFEGAQEADLVRGLLEGRRPEDEPEARLVRSTGDRGWVSLHVSIITDWRGTATSAIVQIVDISGRKEHETYLQQLAGQDPLTGLLNRRRFHVRLEECLERSSVHGESGAVLLLDLNRFKRVKDELGQAAGDELLRLVAGALHQRVRSTDVLAKLGGAEFAAVLMNADGETAPAVACELVEAVRAAVESAHVECVDVTPSVGIAIFEAGSLLSADTLLVAADRALYRAKGLGPGVVASLEETWVADPV